RPGHRGPAGHVRGRHGRAGRRHQAPVELRDPQPGEPAAHAGGALPPPLREGLMTGTGPLLRLILRRDRFIAPLWTVILSVIPLSYLSTTATLFPDDTSRAAYALGVQSDPAQRGLLGPVFGDSVGALTIWRSGIVLVLVGLASLLTVIR